MQRRNWGLVLILCLFIMWWWSRAPEFRTVSQIATTPLPTPPHVRGMTTIVTPPASFVFGMGAAPATPHLPQHRLITPSSPRTITRITDTITLDRPITHTWP